ncbi:MAG: DEAD/DEAH box helicase [Candidatus Hodarchaeales archaeon]|jgi:superfamily II DNA or RNA helicase
MQGASIKEEAWDNYQISQKEKYKITIQEDLLINAWIPIRRSHYKRERSRDLNIEDIFEYLKKEEDSEEYDRKFFFPSWVEEHYRIWTRNWRKLNGYWDHKSTHRPTKFILQFPQLIMEDIEILKRAGVEVIFSDGVKEKLGELQETGINDYLIEVETVTDKLRVRWNKKFNTWFHSIFTVFVRYMAIRSEDDPNSDYLPCVTQIGEREIEVAYWAAFRANHFWRIVEKCVKNSKTATLFKLDYQLYQLPEKKWKTDTQENYELRSYQKTAIDKWFENQQFGTIQLPTGAGKTLIGIHAIRKVQQRTLILVPNLALVDQWVDQIGKFINIKPAQIGIFTGQKKAFRKYPVVISTFQLLAQYLQDFHALEQKQVDKVSRDKILVEDTIGFFTERFGLLIADESHHIQAETFRFIAVDLQIPRRMALSATIEKTLHSSLVVAVMGPIIHKISYGLLAREGFIAPIYSRRIHIPLTSDEKGIINQKGKSSYGKVSREARYKMFAVHKLLESPLTSQTLIFTSRINHAKALHKFLKERKITTTLLTGDTVLNEKEFNILLEKFRKNEINTLILVKMLNEGFDAPADTIIVVSGTKNRREQVQRVGRATRPGKVAKLFELIVDPMELEYEYEIAESRSIDDVIEPHVQDMLLPHKEKYALNQLVDDIKLFLYEG